MTWVCILCFSNFTGVTKLSCLDEAYFSLNDSMILFTQGKQNCICLQMKVNQSRGINSTVQNYSLSLIYGIYSKRYSSLQTLSANVLFTIFILLSNNVILKQSFDQTSAYTKYAHYISISKLSGSCNFLMYIYIQHNILQEMYSLISGEKSIWVIRCFSYSSKFRKWGHVLHFLRSHSANFTGREKRW